MAVVQEVVKGGNLIHVVVGEFISSKYQVESKVVIWASLNRQTNPLNLALSLIKLQDEYYSLSMLSVSLNMK